MTLWEQILTLTWAEQNCITIQPLNQNKMSQSKNISNGIGIGTVLFLIFLVLKLTNTINWSWWWVTSPIWIPIALFILLSGIMVLIEYNRLRK